LIQVERVSKRYGRVEALSGVTLDIPRGKTIGLLGPSGSGKTSLLRIIAGLEYPSGGRVFIDGQLASSPDYVLESYKRGISAVFQTPALWPNMTVKENIEYVNPACSQVLLDRAGLTELIDRYPNELSSGEARRVSIVRALSADKPYLLLDEPLVNLNPELNEILHDLIVEETRRRGQGVLYISHDAGELTHADKVYIMRDGVIEEPE